MKQSSVPVQDYFPSVHSTKPPTKYVNALIVCIISYCSCTMVSCQRSHLFFFQCLRMAKLRNCGLSWFISFVRKKSLKHMRTAKVQVSLRIRAVRSCKQQGKGNLNQKIRNQASLRGRACALKCWFDGRSEEHFYRDLLS